MDDRSEGRRKRLGVSYLPFTIDDPRWSESSLEGWGERGGMG